jgi:hypothetical protein
VLQELLEGKRSMASELKSSSRLGLGSGVLNVVAHSGASSMGTGSARGSLEDRLRSLRDALIDLFDLQRP